MNVNCLLLIINIWRILKCSKIQSNSSTNSTFVQKIHDFYGAYKLSIISYISLDNKLRYCSYNNILCIIGTDRVLYFQKRKEFEKNQLTSLSVNPSRLLKIHWIDKLLKFHTGRKFLSTIMYTDLDIVISRIDINITDVLLHLSETAHVFISSDFLSHRFLARFQTGFFLLRRLRQMQEVFHFMNLESMSNIAYLHSTPNKNFESDQYLFNKHIRCLKSSIGFEAESNRYLPYAHGLKECRISDIGYSGHVPPRQRILLMNISREVFNAFPSHPSPWRSMGLPHGDERNDSLIIHFAGSGYNSGHCSDRKLLHE